MFEVISNPKKINIQWRPFGKQKFSDGHFEFFFAKSYNLFGPHKQTFTFKIFKKLDFSSCSDLFSNPKKNISVVAIFKKKFSCGHFEFYFIFVALIKKQLIL